MPKHRLTWLATLCALAALLAGAAPAAADAPAPLPSSDSLDQLLAFTPTGDALWDKYASALLDGMKQQPLAPTSPAGGWRAPVVPDSVLAQWEPQFGNDPRYWQLRYFERRRAGMPRPGGASIGMGQQELQRALSPPGGIPTGALEEGDQRGISDAASLWCEYLALGASDSTRRSALLDRLVQQMPEESFSWYLRGLAECRAGAWSAGLADLKAGNAAPHNRVPYPFPLSFVIDRLHRGEPLGSEVAAGMVVQNAFVYSFYSEGLTSRQVWRDLPKRVKAGNGWEDAKTVHDFCCRLETMDRADGVQRIMAIIPATSLLRQLLTDDAAEFQPEQRRQLLLLYNGWEGRLYNALRYDLHDHEPQSNAFLESELAARKLTGAMLAQYVVHGDPAERFAQVDELLQEEQQPDGATPEMLKQQKELAYSLIENNPTYRLNVTLLALEFELATADMRFEQTTAADKVKEIVERYAEFDWAKITFPSDRPATGATSAGD
jgi:hypothetical protein